MKRNTFYLLMGFVGLIEVAVFWWSVETHMPLYIEIAFVLGVIGLYLAKQRVEEVIEDERTNLITQQAALRTLEVFWVVFFAMALGGVALSLGGPLPRLPRPLPPIPDIPVGQHIRIFGGIQLALLCVMVFLYVGFRIYYARKYGEWDDDEE
ncbi:MAG: DUF2178 domain-containing protein [Methanomicrobiaceae archaeon]|nr:DUF2178 domain-containing protein [Methanomicrobiaceae archaeon]